VVLMERANMSESCWSACCWEVPTVLNGDAGVGCWRACVNASAAVMALLGKVQLWGKKETVSAICSKANFVTY
jgi:hypothetical protein